MDKTLDLIWTRRSIRDFQRREVDKDTVDTLKRMTLRAPSAGNMEMYSIIEIKDSVKKRKLAEICDGQKIVENAPLVWIFLADMEKWYDYFRFSSSPEKYGIPMPPLGMGDLLLSFQDAVIAAENSVIAAEALGLGSCYIGDVLENAEKLIELLDLPEHVVPASALIYGHPKTNDRHQSTPRPEITSSIFMTDCYRRRTLVDLEDEYSGHTAYNTQHKRVPFDGKGTVADEYYGRKFTSSFMAEMNRSALHYVLRYLGKDDLDK
ncbi:MAG: nitroreductase family protein [Candidatus Ornithospirochaeta sp.]